MKTFFSLSSSLKSLSVLALFFFAGFSAQAQYAYVTNNATQNMSVQIRVAQGALNSCTGNCLHPIVNVAPGITDIQTTCGFAAVGARVNADGCTAGFGSVLAPACACSLGVSSDADVFVAQASCSGYTADQKIEITSYCVGNDIYITIDEI